MKIERIGVCTCGIAILLAAISSVLGLLSENIYYDNEYVISMWRGNDAVTAIIVVPMIIYSLLKYRKSSGSDLNGILILSGGLWYLIYNYMFYLYGAKYNSLFIVYVLIIALSSVGLVHIILSAKSHMEIVISNEYKNKSFKKIGIFMRAFALVLGVMWLAMIVTGLVQGEVPAAIIQTGHPTGVVFATDLIFLVTPLFVLGSYISKNNIIVIVLSFAILLKCVLYPMVFIVAGINTYINIGKYDPLTPVYLILGLISGYQLLRIKAKLSK